MEFYMEPVINMFDHLKIKILKAEFKRTVQFYSNNNQKCQILSQKLRIIILILLRYRISFLRFMVKNGTRNLHHAEL